MWDRHRWDVTVPSPDQCQEGGKGAEISLSLPSTSPSLPPATPCHRPRVRSRAGGRGVATAIRYSRVPFRGRLSSDAAGKVIFFLLLLRAVTLPPKQSWK